MAPFANLVVRDDSNINPTGLTPATINLLIVLLVVLFLGLLSVVGLLLLRNHRRSKEAALPMYEEVPTKSLHYRRLTVTVPSYDDDACLHDYDDEKHHHLSPASPQSSDAVPEIRITFPDEEAEGGRRTSGRVVLVRVGETSIGLEPLDESLPPYQSSDSARFQSLDLDRIGDAKPSSHP